MKELLEWQKVRFVHQNKEKKNAREDFVIILDNFSLTFHPFKTWKGVIHEPQAYII